MQYQQITSSASQATAFIEHHLCIFGLTSLIKKRNQAPFKLFYYAGIAEIPLMEEVFLQQGVCVVFLPEKSLLEYLGITLNKCEETNSYNFIDKYSLNKPGFLLRTLSAWQSYSTGYPLSSVVTDQKGNPVWLWISRHKGKLLLVGTDLFNDLLRYRQGDFHNVFINKNKAAWGFEFERPNYLYEPQINKQPHYARFADNWAELLASLIAKELNIFRDPILPGGAKGAVIITGDDDQAYLETYKEQLDILGDMPITYFMHPLTNHNAYSTKKMLRRKNIDLGIHPDALDDPTNYTFTLNDQVKWFKNKFKISPLSVRNHGYLNDGYWGHLDSWIKHGLQFSSNIPGLNGRAVNGSYLPARVSCNGHLTNHWSLLTAIGDGVIFIFNYDEKQAAQVVYDTADAILQSGIPGIMVLNLHPQNIDRTRSMHYAAINLVNQEGFYPWTMEECYKWFCRRDRCLEDSLGGRIINTLNKLVRI